MTDMSVALGVTPAEAYEAVAIFERQGGYSRLAPIPGAVEGVARLAKHHWLESVSLRPVSAERDTRAWFHERFGPAIRALHMNTLGGAKMDKGEICSERGIDVFVEDNPDVAAQCVEKGIYTLLMRRAWNRRIPAPQGAVCVESWAEVLEAVEAFVPCTSQAGGRLK